MLIPKSIIGEVKGITMTGLVKLGWIEEGILSKQSHISVSSNEGRSIHLVQENNHAIIIMA